jgi:hypothetical protein
MPLDPARLTAMMLRRAPDSVRVVWGSLVTYGLFRSAGDLEAVDGGFLPVTTRSLLIQAGAFTGLAQNATVTIAPVRSPASTTTFQIRSPALSVENGDLVRFLVTPVT